MPSKRAHGNGKHGRNGTNGNGRNATTGTNGRVRTVHRLKEHPVRPGDPRINPKGRLLIIGGHEDKEDGQVILRRLAQLVGSGKLVVATLASEKPGEMWEQYEAAMRVLGVRHLYHLRIGSRADAESARAMGVLEDAAAVFFTGGDQLRLTSLIGDTPVFSRCYEIFAAGGTIAGTSAGASVMTETMIISGNGDASPHIGNGAQLGPGFGFLKDVVIDQHFAERGRLGRLLGVVALNPRILGLGIDENTAIEVDPLRGFRVFGKGSVYVVDAADVSESNIAEESRGRALSVFGVRLHLLTQGDQFDFASRTPACGSADEVDEELGVEEDRAEESEDERETAAAGKDK